MAHLFADENVPMPVVEELRAAGHDVETALDAGLANRRIPDDAVLLYATQETRSVLTSTDAISGGCTTRGRRMPE